MPVNQPTRRVKQFNGLRTTDEPEEVGLDGLVTAENIEITRQGRLHRRPGQTLSSTTATDSGFISGGSGLLTAGTDLLELHADLTTTLIRSDLTPEGDIIFAKFGERIYYSNGTETGVLRDGSNRTLGLDRPDTAPVATSTAGDMDPGRVLYACAFGRADGQESGFSPVGLLETQEGGLDFTDIPVSADPDVVTVTIYLTHPGGTEFYKAFTVLNGVDTGSFRAHQTFLTFAETTQYLDKPPAFHDIVLHNSRMIYASGDYLYYSEPFAFELVDMRFNWIDLGGPARVLGTVPGGLFVATDSATWYLGGTDIKDATLVQKADYGGVPRTLRHINANLLDGDLGDTPLPVWAGATGFVVGTATGELINFSETVFEIPTGVTGTAMVRKDGKQNHYIAVLKS